MHGVRNEARSLYQILGVPTDATAQQIERAYQRLKREQQQETTPPDQRLRVLIEHAHDVLTDPASREQYDRDSGTLPQIARKITPARVALIVVAFTALGAGAWWLFSRDEAPAVKREVADAVAMAVGRVARIEPSGTTTPLGLAFAIAEGTLVTSCEGITPAVELVVEFGKRAAPVHATAIDEATQLCKLGGGAVGSWPLALSTIPPSTGLPVYAVGTAGTAAQARETRYGRAPPRKEDLGGPLLDSEARVVAVASRVNGTLVYVPPPRTWVPTEAVIYSAPEPKVKTVEPPSLAPNVSPERQERLEKAFRPPIVVPPDL